MNARSTLSSLIELVGLAAVVYGVYLFSPRAAVVVGGGKGVAAAPVWRSISWISAPRRACASAR